MPNFSEAFSEESNWNVLKSLSTWVEMIIYHGFVLWAKKILRKMLPQSIQQTSRRTAPLGEVHPSISTSIVLGGEFRQEGRRWGKSPANSYSIRSCLPWANLCSLGEALPATPHGKSWLLLSFLCFFAPFVSFSVPSIVILLLATKALRIHFNLGLLCIFG